MSILALLFGAFIIGFNPYFKNLILHENIFYPLMGKGAIDIVTPVTPSEVLGMGKIASFFESNFYFPNILHVTNYDSRLGGFGFMFPILLISSLLLYACMFVLNIKFFSNTTMFLLFLAALIFINPAPWMARYVPFTWITPLIISYYGMKCKNRYARGLADAILVIQLVAAIIILFQVIFFNFIGSRSIYLQLKDIKNYHNPIVIDFGPFQSLRHRLDYYEIFYVNRRLTGDDLNSDIRCLANTWCEVKFLKP